MRLSEWYKPTPRQKEAHNCNSLYIGYGGAVGGGKSVFLCVDVFLQAFTQPGNRIFMGRKIARHFRETTLQTWIRTIPAQFYSINESKSEISVYCNPESVIQYGGLLTREDLSRWLSAEYGGIAIDQAEELNEEDFLTILPRLRLTLPGGKSPRYRALFSANPRNGAFKQRFINNPQKDWKFIAAKFSDNPYLPSDYIPRLRELYKTRPEMLNALVEGDWTILEGSDVIIKAQWIDQANRNPYAEDELRRGVTVDPARFGDDETVIYGMNSTKVIRQNIFSGMDTYSIAGKAIDMCKETGGNWIIVDEIGVGGGVIDSARHILGDDQSIMIYGFNGAAKARDPERFYNARAEAWWTAGEKFAQGKVSLNNDPILSSQLSSAKYTYSGGRILVEDKDDIKKEIGQSPDRADALVMALWYLKSCPILREKDVFQWNKKRIETQWEWARKAPVGNAKGYYDQESI